MWKDKYNARINCVLRSYSFAYTSNKTKELRKVPTQHEWYFSNHKKLITENRDKY